MAAIARNAIKAPFVWFGGKSRQAETVWRYFGADVSNYVEPFAGTIAVLLGRPGGAGKLETINDRDCYVANVWRSIQHDPYGVAAYCDYPISEVDLHARHQWLVQHLRNGADFRERMLSDPDHYDARKAGWWLWGISQWIGGGWCREPGQGDVAKGRRPNLHNSTGVHQKIPDLYARGNGRGIRCAAPERDSADAYEPPTKHQIPALHGKRGTEAPPQKRPDLHGAGVNTRMLNLGNTRRGVHRDRLPAGHSEIANALLAEIGDGRAPPCFHWFVALLDRLRRVRMVCGDWRRVLTPSVLGTTTTRNSGMTPCAVFLDPPYGDDVRDPYLYSVDDGSIAAQVAAWAIKHGDDPDLRVAVCGFEGEHEFPDNWTVHAWKGVKGYGSGKNRDKERIWFSPHCLPLEGAVRQGVLFAAVEG